MFTALTTVGWTPLLGLLGVLATAVLSYFTGIRNNKSAERQKQIDATPGVATGYSNLLKDSKDFYEGRLKEEKAEHKEELERLERRFNEKIEPLQTQVTTLTEKDIEREAEHLALIEYMKLTFEGLSNGSIPPIIPVPAPLAARFDKALIDSLLADAMEKVEQKNKEE